MPVLKLISDLLNSEHKYMDFLYSYAMQQTNYNEAQAQDAVQSTIEAALRMAKCSDRQTLKNPAGFLLELCRYYASVQHGWDSREVLMENPHAADYCDLSDQLFEKLVRDDSPAELRRKLYKMKPHYLNILIMRFFYQLSYESIAAMLECSVNAAYTRVSRAKNMAREIFMDLDENGGELH